MSRSDAPRAAVIAIGTELTTGARLDTNSAWLSRELSGRGFHVVRHATVPDDLSLLQRELNHSASEADVVLLTGGLGPTRDDVTREALALWLGVPLQLHQQSLRQIEAFFTERGKPMSERNRLQAMFPASSEPLPNPIGTAPGIWIDTTGTSLLEHGTHRPSACRLAALPGVPVEMKRMFREQVLPRLPPAGCVRQLVIHLSGIGESDAEARLGELTGRGQNPEVGITAHEGTLSLRIWSRAESVEACERLLEQTRQLVRERLGEYVFGEGDCTLADVVVSELARRGHALDVVDLETRGELARALCEATRRGGCQASLPGGGRDRFGEPDPGQVLLRIADVSASQPIHRGSAARVPADAGPHGIAPLGRVPVPLVDDVLAPRSPDVPRWKVLVGPLTETGTAAAGSVEPPASAGPPGRPARMIVQFEDPGGCGYACVYQRPQRATHSPRRAACFVLDRFRRLLLFPPPTTDGP